MLLVILVAQVKNQGGIFLDGRGKTGRGREFRELMFQHAAFAGFRQALLQSLAGFFVLDRRDQLFNIDARVPHVHDSHLAVFRHVFAIGPHAAQHGIAGGVFTEAVVAAGQYEAGGQAFHVPFPGAGRVSSRSLMSKITRRSGVAYAPKFTDDSRRTPARGSR